jgi:OCT family organic cation transporter-like MFS transporter 4/5
MASQDFSELDILEDTRINEANRREPVTFDKVLLVLGEFGHFQKLLYFMFSLPYVETAMQLLGWVFVGATPGHKCPSDNSTTNQTSGYDFDTTHVMSSVVMEWHLVCNRSGLHATVGAAPMVGYLVGALIFGTLSDKVGRKPTFLIANLILLLSGLCGSIAPSYVTFVASRFLVGMSIAGVESSCFVMGMELVGPSKRTLAGNTTG